MTEVADPPSPAPSEEVYKKQLLDRCQAVLNGIPDLQVRRQSLATRDTCHLVGPAETMFSLSPAGWLIALVCR